MIKAIFFDLHEVVTHGNFKDIYKRFADRVNISTEIVNDFHRENLGGLLTGTVTSKDMLETFGLDGQLTVEQMLDVWTEEITKLMYADMEMLSLLSKLRKKYRLGALTNLTEQRYGADIKMGLHGKFDFSVLSFKEGVKKPDQNFFLKALERAECTPEESVFIDDQAKNTNAAEELGIKSVQYENIDSLLEKLGALGVEV